MSSLPPEIVSEIADGVPDKRDLRQLRAANKAFHQLVSPDAFRKLYITDTAKSAKGFLNILKTPELAVYVREIIFYDKDVSWRDSEEKLQDNASGAGDKDDVEQQAADEEALDAAGVRSTFEEAFSLLHYAPSLHTLTFKLSSDPQEDDVWDEDGHSPSSTLLHHWAMLGGLAKNPNALPALRSLTLDNLIPFRNPLYDSPHFAAIMAGIHHLDLNVLADAMMEGAYYQDPLNAFWEQADQRILRPAVELRTLRLESNIALGAMPSIDFAQLTYPHLEALSLTHVLFHALPGDSALMRAEDFIARHGKALKRLVLRSCMLYYEEEGAPVRLWSTLWNRYAEELEVLSDLVVEFDPETDRSGVHEDQEMRYCRLDAGHGYFPEAGIEGEEEDVPTLEALKAIVASRA